MMPISPELVDAIAVSRRRGAERHREMRAARRAMRTPRRSAPSRSLGIAVKRVALGASKR